MEHFSRFQITNMATHIHVLILYYTHRLLTSTQYPTSPPPSRRQAVDIVTFQCLNRWYFDSYVECSHCVHISVHNFLHLQWKIFTAYSLLMRSRWVGHVAGMEDRRGAAWFWRGGQTERDNFEDLCANWRIILKWISRK